ncbi:MAG: toll/interleukin-1 receptor domain-containing protein, partial [Dokdonella sp.]
MVVGETEPGFRYWAFISYSHQDQSWGRWLHRALERYRVPPRLVGLPIAAGVIPARLSPIFRDRDELPTATDLGRSVGEALQQSWCLIVVCSPAAAQSRWVNEEVRQFQLLGRAERIHFLIVDEASGAPCFPPALFAMQRDGAAAAEPIAADARRSGDGKSHARLKLIAGILGISYDKLVQREHQRGYRRMATIAIAATFALAVLTVFTVVAITSRREAEAQRGHAESLVEFMLGDLRQKLEPEGQLSTLDAVGKQALAYYAAQDPASLDADALARRARALHMIGEVDDQRGRLDDALGV